MNRTAWAIGLAAVLVGGCVDTKDSAAPGAGDAAPKADAGPAADAGGGGDSGGSSDSGSADAALTDGGTDVVAGDTGPSDGGVGLADVPDVTDGGHLADATDSGAANDGGHPGDGGDGGDGGEGGDGALLDDSGQGTDAVDAGGMDDGGQGADGGADSSDGSGIGDGGPVNDAIEDAALSDAGTDAGGDGGEVDDVPVADVSPEPVPTFCEVDSSGTPAAADAGTMADWPTSTDNLLGVPIPIPPAPEIAGFQGGTCGCKGAGPTGGDVPGECFMAFYEFANGLKPQMVRTIGYDCSFRQVSAADFVPPAEPPYQVETSVWGDSGKLLETRYWLFGKHETIKTRTYDDAGNLVELKVTYPTPPLVGAGSKGPLSRITHEYDDLGRLSRSDVYVYLVINGADTLDFFNTFAYYPDGNEASVTIYDASGIASARVSSIWNEQGLLAREEYDAGTCNYVNAWESDCPSEELDGIPESGTEYEYDEQGRLIKKRDFFAGIWQWFETEYGMGAGDGATWYDYDEKGRLGAEFYSWPEWDGNKNGGIVYVYDQFDRLVQSAGWTEEGTVPAMDIYSYDCWGNPTTKEPSQP